jgi:predicted ATPase
MLKENSSYVKYYGRIVRYIQRNMPQFRDFDLTPIPANNEYVSLNSVDSSGTGFDPQQLSDGTLRYMALATFLLQPPYFLPKFILLDEPELGLHPEAISGLTGMVKIASQYSQILLASQTTLLVGQLLPRLKPRGLQESVDQGKRYPTR